MTMDGFGAIAIITNIAATIAHVTRFTGLEIATRRTFKKNRISLLTRIGVAHLSHTFALALVPAHRPRGEGPSPGDQCGGKMASDHKHSSAGRMAKIEIVVDLSYGCPTVFRLRNETNIVAVVINNFG
jgi:hypothetical protein